jgi:hypothetical protein
LGFLLLLKPVGFSIFGQTLGVDATIAPRHDCSPTAAAMFHRAKEQHVGQAKKPMICLGQKKKMRAWQGLI